MLGDDILVDLRGYQCLTSLFFNPSSVLVPHSRVAVGSVATSYELVGLSQPSGKLTSSNLPQDLPLDFLYCSIERTPATQTLGRPIPTMTDPKPSDLARIRDNQRRSRARRKEYLQELESKFRICERTGAEASSEIQAAARVVAEENKRLRLLLKQHGVRDPNVEEGQSNQAANLEEMLNAYRPCNGIDVRERRSAPPQSQQPIHYEPLPSSDPFVPIQPSLHSSSTSCYAVASVIRSVRPHMGAELEAQLGCSDGRDCNIPNARAFDLLDRLSESQSGGG